MATDGNNVAASNPLLLSLLLKESDRNADLQANAKDLAQKALQAEMALKAKEEEFKTNNSQAIANQVAVLKQHLKLLVHLL